MVSTAPKRAEKVADSEAGVRLTVAQATIRFLGNQYVEHDGVRTKFFAGAFGIFGHGNVAGLGQALLQDELSAHEAGTEPSLKYVLGRNEQAMVHSAVAYARQKDRLQTWAVTASVGPGATNIADRRGARDDQPTARPAAARRHVRDAGELAGAAGAGAAVLRRRHRQRCVQAAVALLRPRVAARAAAVRTARGDARPHRPRRDGRGHRRHPAGRPRPRPTTGRNRCSPNAPGTSPGPCRSGP